MYTASLCKYFLEERPLLHKCVTVHTCMCDMCDMCVGIPGHSEHEPTCTSHNDSSWISQSATHSKYITVKGQREQWLIRLHSELMTVQRPKARDTKPPVNCDTLRGCTVSPIDLYIYISGFTCFCSCFSFLHFLLPADWLLVCIYWSWFTVSWCKCLL